MGFPLLLGALVVIMLVWSVRGRLHEKTRRDEMLCARAERMNALETAAQVVEHQVELSRDVAHRMDISPVEIPAHLQSTLNSVVAELEAVVSDLRSCQIPIQHRHRHFVNH